MSEFLQKINLQGVDLIQPVILCGGSGTRLWPLSRSGFPKQFLCLTSDESLFQQAVKRLLSLGDIGLSVLPAYVVTHEEYRFLVQEQLRELEIGVKSILLEPEARNTAPALTLAALAVLECGEDPILVVAPADQTVLDLGSFMRAMQTAIEQAARGQIVILGVQPDRPETGFGYIKTSADKMTLEKYQHVECFVEKPDAKTAQSYLDKGGYYWNAGIFVLKASVWIKALGHFRPEILNACKASWDARKLDGPFIRPNKDKFAKIPSESIDYAVMENCPGSIFPMVMVPLDAGWSDLGSWDSVWKVLPQDSQDNACLGDVLMEDSHRNLVHASHRLVSLVGVQDLIVVETADALLIADRLKSQKVKKIVDFLNQQKRSETKVHRKNYRPWGACDVLDQGDQFKVNRITVNPGASLTLQKHEHRAEHWIVLKGIAEVRCGEKEILLSENQSTYISPGQIHQLRNPGEEPLEVIEIQTGRVNENDIVRFLTENN